MNKKREVKKIKSGNYSKEEHSKEPISPTHPKHLYGRIHALVEHKLWLQVIFALFFGIGIGLLIGPDIGLIDFEISKLIGEWASLPGILFLKIIQIVVIPLIFVSIIIGITGAKNLRQLKQMGLTLAGYFIFTTIVAVTIAILLASTIQPGKYISQDSINLTDTANLPLSDVSFSMPSFNEIPSFIDRVFPTNLVGSMVYGELLAIVFFAIIFGIALIAINPRKARPLISLLSAVQSLCMTIIKWAMFLAPIAVFGMMIKLTTEFGISTLLGLGAYVLTVLIGLLILIIFYFIIVYIFAKKTPREFIKQIRDAQLLAFSTSSSAAVMPLSMKVAEEKLKVKPAVAQFVIPTGAVINMDGTALYQVIATMFLAQVFGVSLGITALLLLIVTVVGASIGTPSTPGAGIAILAMILTGLGIPLAGIALILGVDRILDMSRTTVNVTGDLTASVFIDKVVKST
ncbi:dicarboxylate/amino acid:cation symporter [Candidatus Pacearchaeota archaeon]|nr:dicarboxylate/amino acid:cation symporter [Candidatus Pacearchaeota archaeon]